MKDKPHSIIPGSKQDAAAESESELSQIRKRLRVVEAQYRASEEHNKLMERQLWLTEELLQRAQQKVQSAKRKQLEADHYRSLLHQLRSRWFLRPFIPRRKLRPREDVFAGHWLYRGPRFEPPPATSGLERRPHRVLVVGHLLSAMLFGSERSLLEMITALDPSRFDVFAVFPERNERVFADLQPNVQGIAVLDYSWWSKSRPFNEDGVLVFEEICRRLAIDLVHANTIMLSDPLIAARRVGLPAITHARELISRDQELAERLGGDPREIARLVCENASYLLANSAATLADYPCGAQGSYLHNSIDPDAFDLCNVVDPTCIKVGLVSSNVPKKGILDFVQLAREADKRLPALHFSLVGPENDFIKQLQAGAQPLPGNFHLSGYAWRAAEAYRDLNIVVNLSLFAESFGRTVAEAMVARRPAIAYRYGALPELIDDGETGFLVPYLDLAAVLERLSFFVEKPENITRFGEMARSRVTERCSPLLVGRTLGALYERLIGAQTVPQPTHS